MSFKGLLLPIYATSTILCNVQTVTTESISGIKGSSKLQTCLSSDTNTMGSAEDKFNKLWDQIESTRFDPENTDNPSPHLMGLFKPWETKHSFTDCSDTMQNGREKVIHKSGLVVHAKWVPITNPAGYTGIFQKENVHVIARFSHLLPPFLLQGKPWVFPNLAMKFLVDDEPSVNFLATHEVTGQDDHDLFRYPYSNRIPQPPIYVSSTVGLSFGIAKWSAQDKWFPSMDTFDAAHLNIEPLAQVGLDDDEEYISPHVMVCEGSDEIKEIYDSTEYDITTTDFRIALNGKGQNAKIFDCYAGRVAEDSKIGEVYAMSNLFASTFADESLFFQHH